MSKAIHGGNVWEASRRFGRSPKEFLDFSSNLNPLGPPRAVQEVLAQHLQDVAFYPDPEAREAREHLAAWLDVPVESVLLTNGGVEALYLALFLFQPRRLLSPVPTFVEGIAGARAVGAEVLEVTASPREGFQLPLGALLKGLSHADLVYLCNPNNPTGVLASREKVLRIVREAKGRCAVLVDEAFVDFAGREHSLVQEATRADGVVVIGSLTKLFAFPGLRLGYAVASPSTIEALRGLQPPWSVNILAQHALIAALSDRAYVAETIRLISAERAFLSSQISSLAGYITFPSQTNFLLVDISGTGLRSGELWERLGRWGILVRDCASIPGLGDWYIRVAVRKREENLALLAAMAKESVPQRS
ncbi:MAG: threonine-phosphate decarboxylase CobD [Armatimonadota bacterium]|nr:threonine-phosphate decarboxylase CobD [Armatimonadota bacterium]